jgi:PhnB protein
MKEMNAYLIFNGNCREAASFYQKCLGADLQLITFGDMGGNVPPDSKDRIAHARISKGATVLLASDNMPVMTFNAGDNYFVCLNCESVQETDKLICRSQRKRQNHTGPTGNTVGSALCHVHRPVRHQVDAEFC